MNKEPDDYLDTDVAEDMAGGQLTHLDTEVAEDMAAGKLYGEDAGLKADGTLHGGALLFLLLT